MRQWWQFECQFDRNTLNRCIYRIEEYLCNLIELHLQIIVLNRIWYVPFATHHSLVRSFIFTTPRNVSHVSHLLYSRFCVQVFFLLHYYHQFNSSTYPKTDLNFRYLHMQRCSSALVGSISTVNPCIFHICQTQ